MCFFDCVGEFSIFTALSEKALPAVLSCDLSLLPPLPLDRGAVAGLMAREGAEGTGGGGGAGGTGERHAPTLGAFAALPEEALSVLLSIVPSLWGAASALARGVTGGVWGAVAALMARGGAGGTGERHAPAPGGFRVHRSGRPSGAVGHGASSSSF